MRVDGVPVQAVKPTGGTVQQQPSGDQAKLSEGQVIQARVLSVGDGTATLRSADGTLLQARLENNVTLTPGTDVYLSVRSSDSAITVLSPVYPDAAGAALTQQAADPVLNQIFDQLTSLGYQPTADNMTAMRQILEQNPDMTMREAAFFAAQKLEPSEANLNAFRTLLSGEAGTASLLDSLAATAAESAEPDIAAPQTVAVVPLEAALPPEQSAVQAGNPNQSIPDTVNNAEIPVVIASATLPEPEAPVKPPVDSLAQALDNAINAQSKDFPEAETTAPPPQAGSNAPPPEAPVKLPEFGRWLLEALGTAKPDAEGTAVLTGEVLAGSPLLEGLSSRSLSGMADSLNRIAASMPQSSSEAELFENISSFAKSLFIRLDGEDDTKLQERLREAREDLYVKLAYFRDAVASSGSSSKHVVLEQTQKLMDHVKLLNGLEQFVCVQIPVQLEDQRRNAELYVYKREKNGSNRIDPENVKILLALDLINMGHLETLIEIQGRDVSLRFEVTNDGVADALRQNSARLHTLLDAIGYKFAGSTVVTKKSETTIETALLSLMEAERGRGKMNMII